MDTEVTQPAHEIDASGQEHCHDVLGCHDRLLAQNAELLEALEAAAKSLSSVGAHVPAEAARDAARKARGGA